LARSLTTLEAMAGDIRRNGGRPSRNFKRVASIFLFQSIHYLNLVRIGNPEPERACQAVFHFASLGFELLAAA
jgi:hypothetical protein